MANQEEEMTRLSAQNTSADEPSTPPVTEPLHQPLETVETEAVATDLPVSETVPAPASEPDETLLGHDDTPEAQPADEGAEIVTEPAALPGVPPMPADATAVVPPVVPIRAAAENSNDGETQPSTVVENPNADVAETSTDAPAAENPNADVAETPTPTENLNADVQHTPEDVSAEYALVDEADDHEDELLGDTATDYSQFSKDDFLKLLTAQLAVVTAADVRPSSYRTVDKVVKESKPAFEQMKRGERASALQSYITDTGSEDGFEFHPDPDVQRIDDVYRQIRTQRNAFFQQLEKAKESNFTAKTELLSRLRELVEQDEANAADPKTSYHNFQKIQEEWKAAGNINSSHNATLWQTYHALVDRYYSNRNIYFELKDLDRKRNATQKTEVIEKIEAIVSSLGEGAPSRQVMEEANALFEEYKHIGPAPRTEQEAFWKRLKHSMDALYDRRRAQTNEQRREAALVYEQKSGIYEALVPLTSFSSGSINDWNTQTKAAMELQERWNAVKGVMPREEGKELSKKFWGALKSFFHNKSEFFKQLEAKRDENLRQKVALCEQVEAILAANDETPDATQRVIELQRQWKNIGQVPEKQKNSIFERFKSACDTFFDRKRSQSKETDRSYEENLAKKTALLEQMEATSQQNATLEQLNTFRQQWAEIGYVPRNDMQAVQKRYIKAINALVGATAGVSAKDKEQILREANTETGPTRTGSSRGQQLRFGNDRLDGNRRDSDKRRKISALENDIATYRNNIEFFARSKNADKLRADIDKKIAQAETQLEQLRRELEE